MTTTDLQHNVTTVRWPLLTRVVKFFLRIVFRCLYRVEIKGLEHYHQAQTPLVIVANHVSFLDPVLLGSFLPLTPTYAINTRVAQQPFIKFSCSILANVFEMDPTNPLSSKALIKYLKQGHRAIIFPEGRISTTGTLMKIYDGTGMIAEKAGAKVLPCGSMVRNIRRLQNAVFISVHAGFQKSPCLFYRPVLFIHLLKLPTIENGGKPPASFWLI